MYCLNSLRKLHKIYFIDWLIYLADRYDCLNYLMHYQTRKLSNFLFIYMIPSSPPPPIQTENWKVFSFNWTTFLLINWLSRQRYLQTNGQIYSQGETGLFWHVTDENSKTFEFRAMYRHNLILLMWIIHLFFKTKLNI